MVIDDHCQHHYIVIPRFFASPDNDHSDKASYLGVDCARTVVTMVLHANGHSPRRICHQLVNIIGCKGTVKSENCQISCLA